jgi:hypothetical protein
MNEHPELLDALRALAAEGPTEAPPQVEERLKREFHRLNRRRNLITWAPALSAVAAVAIALLLWMHRDQAKPPAAVAIQATAPAIEDESDASFYPLPEAEVLPAVESAMVVRVQLPVSSLQLMGVPISNERAGASVEADLLLGQDGLARAVRLVE